MAGYGYDSDKKSSYASKAKPDLVETAISAGSFDTLVSAVKQANLVTTLKDGGPFTIFAPTDTAFGKLPEATLSSLMKAENRGKLAEILTYHVIPGDIRSGDVSEGKVKTVAGQEVEISIRDGKVFVNNAQVIKTDVVAENGVIHVIDGVLLPPAPEDSMALAE